MRILYFLLIFIMTSSIQQVHAAFDLNDIIQDSACDKFKQEVERWVNAGDRGYVILRCEATGKITVMPPLYAKSFETKSDARALSPLPRGSGAYSFTGAADVTNLCVHFSSDVAAYLTPSERAIFFYLYALETDGNSYSVKLTDQRITSIMKEERTHVFAAWLANYTLIALQQPEKYGWTALKNELFGRSTDDKPGLKALLNQYAPVFESSRFRACVP